MLSIETPNTTKMFERNLLHSKMNWEKGIKNGADNAGESVVRRARTLLDTGIRTGRKYSRLPHRSSAPGEMPRSQSGRLSRLMFSKTGGIDNFRVGNTAAYARFLSDGTKHMKPRKSKTNPWLEFVIQLEERNTEKYLHNGVLREIM